MAKRGHGGPDAGRGMSGGTAIPIGQVIKAKLKLRKFGGFSYEKAEFARRSDKARSNRNLAENGNGGLEFRHVLMDYNEVPYKQLKAKMMTRRDAYFRNKSLEGTKFAWALCNL